MHSHQAESAIVENRGSHYTVPPALAKHFSEEEMADLKVHFGMFDADGGGSIAADELMGVLEDMGMEPTEEQVVCRLSHVHVLVPRVLSTEV